MRKIIRLGDCAVQSKDITCYVRAFVERRKGSAVMVSNDSAASDTVNWGAGGV